MSLIFMVVMGAFLCVIAFQVRINNNITLIPNINEKHMKKIKKPSAVASDFGNALFLMSGACFVSAALDYQFGKVGLIIGFILVVITAINWATLLNKIDENIKSRKY
ncbi:MAG: hypothetical protein ACRC7N_16920 [Clostridium sp.]